VASLPPNERAKVKNIATLIVRSFRPGCKPVRTIRLVGHADRDIQRGPAFEKRISIERTVAVQQALKQLINNPAISSRITWDVSGVGATSLVVPKPRTEADRARNRRVEVSLNGKGPDPGSPDYIRWAQGCLNQVLGIRLAVTGVMEPRTGSAIRAFQQRQGLAINGIITPQTATALVSACGSPLATFSLPHRFQIETPGIQYTDSFTMASTNLSVDGKITSQPDDPDTDTIRSYRLYLKDSNDLTVEQRIINLSGKQCAQFFHVGQGRYRLAIQTGDKIRRGAGQQPRLIGTLFVTEDDRWPLCG
jgi:hypothetical protein